MKNRKTQLAAAVGAALLAIGGAAQAQQPLKVEVSGQVSRALIYADDGVQKKTFNADNDISGTRFRFVGSAGMTPSIRAGVRLEWDYQSNESNLVTMANGSAPAVSSATASPTLAERYLEAWFEAAGWGRLYLGQGDGAANDGTEVDLSGTGIISSVFVSELGGGIAFRNTAGGLGPTVSASITQQDFESRYDRVMYVTPTFGGFRGQVSTGTKDGASTSEASLWYAGKFAGFGDLAAAIGYSNQGGPITTPGAAHDETMGGSVSFLHTSGINLTYAHSQRDIPLTTAPDIGSTRDGKFDYFKVGYKWGQHAVGVDYAIGKNQSAVDDKVKTIGVGYVWSPIAWAELYAGFRTYELDRPNATFEDISTFTLGTRLKF